MRLLLVLTSTTALLCACSNGGGPNPPGTPYNQSASSALFPRLGTFHALARLTADRKGRVRAVMVYTLSNRARRNEVISFVSRRGRPADTIGPSIPAASAIRRSRAPFKVR